MDNYSRLLERIAQAAKLTSEDIDRRVEAKRAKLSGLVSKEGAAQIVAAELGINFEKERMKLSELVESMRRAHVIGKIISVFPIRTYNKNGKEGRVANLILADATANVRVVLWDSNHIDLVANGKLNVGDVVEISDAIVRNGELHLSSFADIKRSAEIVEAIVVAPMFNEGSLKDVKPGQRLKTRAFIVQVFEPRYFTVCPDCGKKAVDEMCATHGKVVPKRRALLNIVLDDGNETIRSVLFGEHINRLGLTDEDVFSLEQFAVKKAALLGEEKIFSGNVRANTLYNTTEFTIEGVEDVQAEALLKELEAKL